jgi:hypothetical protein
MTDDDSLEDWEYPDPDKDIPDDCASTMDCPHCGSSVFEEAHQCPQCQEYIHTTSDGAILSGWPSWFVMVGLLGVGATILTMSCGL